MKVWLLGIAIFAMESCQSDQETQNDESIAEENIRALMNAFTMNDDKFVDVSSNILFDTLLWHNKENYFHALPDDTILEFSVESELSDEQLVWVINTVTPDQKRVKKLSGIGRNFTVPKSDLQPGQYSVVVFHEDDSLFRVEKYLKVDGYGNANETPISKPIPVKTKPDAKKPASTKTSSKVNNTRHLDPEAEKKRLDEKKRNDEVADQKRRDREARQAAAKAASEEDKKMKEAERLQKQIEADEKARQAKIGKPLKVAEVPKSFHYGPKPSESNTECLKAWNENLMHAKSYKILITPASDVIRDITFGVISDYAGMLKIELRLIGNPDISREWTKDTYEGSQSTIYLDVAIKYSGTYELIITPIRNDTKQTMGLFSYTGCKVPLMQNSNAIQVDLNRNLIFTKFEVRI